MARHNFWKAICGQYRQINVKALAISLFTMRNVRFFFCFLPFNTFTMDQIANLKSKTILVQVYKEFIFEWIILKYCFFRTQRAEFDMLDHTINLMVLKWISDRKKNSPTAWKISAKKNFGLLFAGKLLIFVDLFDTWKKKRKV